MEILDLQAAFKFNISLNFSRNQMCLKPDGYLIINEFKIKIIKKFAIYCSKKIHDIYISEKNINNDFLSDVNIKIPVENDNQSYDVLLTKDNLAFLQSFLCMKTLIITKDNIDFLKFISNKLEICLLSNALDIYEESIKDNIASSIESVKILKDDENIQRLLEKYLQENDPNIIKSLLHNIKELQIGDHYLCQLFTNFCISYPKNINKLITLIKEMDKTSSFINFLNDSMKIPLFQHEKQNILNFVSDYEKQKDQLSINSILQSIRNDNINEFQRITSLNPNFDYNINIREIFSKELIFVNKIALFANINDLFDEDIDNYQINYLDYSAFFGSIKIFKFLLMKKIEMNRFITFFAIAGGNIEIIHLCEQNKCNFKNALKIAIMYRRNELIDWLIESINIDNFESCINDIISFHQNDLLLKYINQKNHEKTIQQLIAKCITYDNYQLFLFLNDVEKIDLKVKYEKNKCNILSLLSSYNNRKFYEFLFNQLDSKSILEEKDIYGLTAAHFAAKSGNLRLLKYLVEKKVNLMSHAYDDLTPLHFACMFGQYEMVEYILAQPNINANCLDRNKQSPLSKICVTNYSSTLKIIDLLLNNIFVKCNFVDTSNKTIILNTIQNGIDEASIKLIKSNKDIAINKSDLYYNPLCLACKLNKIEIVRCILNRSDINVNEQASCGIFI